MRLFAWRDRDLPQSIFRRIDRVAAVMNPFLFAVAVGLAMLDLVYAAQNLVDSLPMAVQVGVRAP